MANTSIRNFRIYTEFTKGTDNDVNNLALGVGDALTGNPAFPTPPVTLADLSAAQVAFNAAMVEARKGGSDRTRAKNTAKQAVVDDLVQIALYCQSIARHDLDTLLSSGYDVVSTSRNSVPLDTPGIISIDNSVSGQLTVRGQGVLNGRMYQVQMSKDGGVTWTNMGNFNGARRMLLQPVTPGTMYMVEICALGGSIGRSVWSNPVSCMAT